MKGGRPPRGSTESSGRAGGVCGKQAATGLNWELWARRAGLRGPGGQGASWAAWSRREEIREPGGQGPSWAAWSLPLVVGGANFKNTDRLPCETLGVIKPSHTTHPQRVGDNCLNVFRRPEFELIVLLGFQATLNGAPSLQMRK